MAIREANLYLVRTMKNVSIDYDIKVRSLEMMFRYCYIGWYQRCYLLRFARLYHGLPITGHIITA